MICLQLFFSFVQIGLFSIGGGYAAMPLIQEQAVAQHGWMTMSQFADIITIAEMTPGPIAINAATFVGIQVAGIPGALAATFGCIFPSVFTVLALAHLYYKYHGLALADGVLGGLRPVVVALIASAGVSILSTVLFGEGGLSAGAAPNWTALALFAAALTALRVRKASPILVMLGCGVLGGVLYTLFPALL